MKKIIENYPRDFEGVWIPREIYLNENLTALDKMIFTEINSLDRHLEKDGDYCYASNQYLADFCGCSISKITKSISKLVDLGLLTIVKTDGRKRWIKSNPKGRVVKSTRQNIKKCDSELQKVPDIKIDYQNIYKNNSNSLPFDKRERVITAFADIPIDFDDTNIGLLSKYLVRYYIERYEQWSGKRHKVYNKKYWSDHIQEFWDASDSMGWIINTEEIERCVDAYFTLKTKSTREFAAFCNEKMIKGLYCKVHDNDIGYYEYDNAGLI